MRNDRNEAKLAVTRSQSRDRKGADADVAHNAVTALYRSLTVTALVFHRTHGHGSFMYSEVIP